MKYRNREVIKKVQNSIDKKNKLISIRHIGRCFRLKYFSHCIYNINYAIQANTHLDLTDFNESRCFIQKCTLTLKILFEKKF